MSKHILFAATLFFCFGQVASAQKSKKGSSNSVNTDVKFLDDISISVTPASNEESSDPKAVFSQSLFTNKPEETTSNSSAPTAIESASGLQFKYALLLDTEVEQVRNLGLFQAIDEWFGTRYKLGGTTKDGIDCSALMQNLYNSFYKISLPRTAKEQYHATRRISRAELKEGDLIFFNTIGGISHVGMYLQNNKFVHASSGGGVTISDLYEDYWMKKFIGAGRVDTTSNATASTASASTGNL